MIVSYDVDLSGFDYLFYNYFTITNILVSSLGSMSFTFFIGLTALYQVFIKGFGMSKPIKKEEFPPSKLKELEENDQDLNKITNKIEKNSEKNPRVLKNLNLDDDDWEFERTGLKEGIEKKDFNLSDISFLTKEKID